MGWYFIYRRNNWSLDPTRADDASWDADQDGLANLCEYQWSLVREAGLQGDLFEEFGESPESVATWSVPDPISLIQTVTPSLTVGKPMVNVHGHHFALVSTLEWFGFV